MSTTQVRYVSPFKLAKELVIEHLYEIPTKYYRNVLVKMVQENNQIHGLDSSEGGIIFSGRTYVPFASTNQKFFRLDRSLEVRFAQYLKDIKELATEQRMSGITMSNGLSIIKTTEELKGIFGTFIFGLIGHLVTEQKIHNKVAYPGNVQMFLDNHTTYLEDMSERVMTNIIMKGAFDS